METTMSFASAGKRPPTTTRSRRRTATRPALQAFGYALFFMRDSALRTLDQTGGFEVGVGPSVVVLDAGTAKSLSTTTMQSDIDAFIFDQAGLMAGVGIQGSKISRIER
jgi:lipid-binding SYLF domain-containing protein